MINLAEDQTELTIVDDQVLSPTWTYCIGNTVKLLLEQQNFGLYHYASKGECSWYDFAEEVFAKLNVDTNLKPISSEELDQEADRPSYSVLESSLSEGNQIDPWDVMLDRYLSNYFK
jgi:dTDP-4-dehydrorhamnose reductase